MANIFGSGKVKLVKGWGGVGNIFGWWAGKNILGVGWQNRVACV